MLYVLESKTNRRATLTKIPDCLTHLFYEKPPSLGPNRCRKKELIVGANPSGCQACSLTLEYRNLQVYAPCAVWIGCIIGNHMLQ